MRTTTRITAGRSAVIVAALLFGSASAAHAVIDGLTGTDFTLTAKADFISTPDGGTLLLWGYADGMGRAQYPGPTLIVNQGDLVTIRLVNTLDMPVSIVFPGQEGVSATGGIAGLLTREADRAGSTDGSGNRLDEVTYQFVAARPGTYLYNSGTRPELQIEMGLLGALIVRPNLGPGFAYNHAATGFDHEYLFLLTEMDPMVHDLVEFGAMDEIDFTAYFPVYWFINGRNAPDTMAEPFVPWLPTQPYNCMPRMRPGERLLMRVLGGGRDLHPFHHHGNHAQILAKDGRLLESGPGAGPDLAFDVFTIQSVPGGTVDAIYQWTGKGLGWDVYGHAPGDPLESSEYAPDHGKPIPVELPEMQNVTIGGFYSGSPFLGKSGPLPPGQGGLNANGGFYHMWHSHTEKEMCNNDIFPGGMMTMVVIEPPGVPIP